MVSPAGLLLSSGCPKFRFSAGAAKINSATVEAIVDTQGRFDIAVAILREPFPSLGLGRISASVFFLSLRGRTRRPAIFKSAGTRVTAVIAETAAIADEDSSAFTFFSEVFETASGADVVVGGLIIDVAVDETSAATDDVSTTNAMDAAVNEAAVISDEAAAASRFLANINELATVADLVDARPLWEIIDDTQTANWQNITNTQTSGWATVDNSQVPAWTLINTI
jgi:hypothetical protein